MNIKATDKNRNTDKPILNIPRSSLNSTSTLCLDPQVSSSHSIISTLPTSPLPHISFTKTPASSKISLTTPKANQSPTHHLAADDSDFDTIHTTTKMDELANSHRINLSEISYNIMNTQK